MADSQKSDRNSPRRRSMSSEHTGALRCILRYIDGWFHNKNPEYERIDSVVDTVEPKLKLAKDYRKRLRGPLEICREHCKAMIAELPGPISLKLSGYGEDPVIKAAFLGSERIENLLKLLVMPHCTLFYRVQSALLF